MQPSPKTSMLVQIGINMLAGMLGAFCVWNYIYSIGSRVISDATYGELEHTMIRGGMAFGMLIGMVLAWKRAGLRLVISLHLLSIFAGCIVGHWGWREGMACYFFMPWILIVLHTAGSLRSKLRA